MNTTAPLPRATPQRLIPPLAPAGALKPESKPADAPKPKPPEPDVSFFSRARATREPIELRLHDCNVLTGRIVAYGTYSVALELETGAEVVVFKNYIGVVRWKGAR